MGGAHTAEQELTLPGLLELGFTMCHINAGVLEFTRARGSEATPTSVQSSTIGVPILLQSRERQGGGSPALGSSVPGEAAGSPGHWLMTKARASRDSYRVVN